MVGMIQEAQNLRQLEQNIEKTLSKASKDDPKPDSLHVTCGIRQDRLLVFIHSAESGVNDSHRIFERVRGAIAENSPHCSPTPQLYLIIHGQHLLPESVSGLSLQTWGSALGLPLLSNRRSPRLRLARLQWHRWQSRIQKNLPSYLRPAFAGKVLGLGLGLGSGLVLALIGLYALSRPCAIGACPLLSQVEQRVKDATQTLESATTTADFRAARQQLQQAVQPLATIPSWSSHYETALRPKNLYQQQIQQLDRLIQAFTLAEQAQARRLPLTAENNDFSLGEAKKIQNLWQDAISDLQSLPPTSPLYTLALLKQQDYQSRLDQLQQHLAEEDGAIAHLHAAEESALLAQSLEETAQSLADWQKVTRAWEIALQRLREIPPDTAPYNASRQAIARYLPRLVQADKRQQTEADAVQYSQKSSQFATKATKAQTQQQWGLAIAQWQQAIAQLQAIPPRSQPASNAQNLLPGYRLALQQAEAQQQAANQRLALDQDLRRICQNQTHICDYDLSDRLIRLTLTPTYLAQVWNTALQAQAQANVPTQIELLNHVSRLEQNLQSLSQRSGLSIEVYDAQGTLLSRYEMR